MHRNSEMTLNEVSTVVDARTSSSPPAGPSATSARRSPTTVGGKYRVSSKAGRVTPSPAKFESGSVPRSQARPPLRGKLELGRHAATHGCVYATPHLACPIRL